MKLGYWKCYIKKFCKINLNKFYTNGFLKNNFTFKSNQNFSFKQAISTLGFVSFFSLNNVALCHNISDKEIDKMRNNLEEQIKNLEFKYQGKLKRQNVKYLLN